MQYTTMAVGADAEELGGGACWDTLGEALADAKASWAFLLAECPDLDRIDVWTLEGYDRAELVDTFTGAPKRRGLIDR